METTVKCPICGRPYKCFDMYAGDQSACPKCISEAEGNMGDWISSNSTHPTQ